MHFALASIYIEREREREHSDTVSLNLHPVLNIHLTCICQYTGVKRIQHFLWFADWNHFLVTEHFSQTKFKIYSDI